MNIFTGEDLPEVRNDLEGVSIGVFLTYRESHPRRNFRCINCGKLCFQYDGEPAMILESDERPLKTGRTEHLCTRCRVSYAILW